VGISGIRFTDKFATEEETVTHVEKSRKKGFTVAIVA